MQPRSKDAKTARGAAAPPSGAQPPVPVVVVEDQISMRKALRRVLEGSGGFLVEEFGTVRDAIEYLKGHPVELVVSDIYLPKGSGIELLRHIRSRPVGNDLPVVFVTGEATKDDIVQAVDLGVNNYLIKPFEPGDLLSKARAAVEKWRNPSPRVRRLREAEAHFFRGDLDAAEKAFHALLEEDPESVRVMVSLAQVRARLGRTEDALRLIEDSVRSSPIYFPAYAVATDLLLSSGRKQEAVDYLNKELSIHGKQAARRCLLADLHFEMNNPKAGLEQVRQALIDFPTDESVLLKMGELQFLSGDVEKAIHYYVKTRRKNPGCTRALDGIAHVCASVGDAQRAMRMFDELLRTQPTRKDVLLARARLNEKLGSFDPALGDVDTFLISEPESVEALLIRGRLLLRLGLGKEAAQNWEEIEAIAPTAENHAKIGLVCLKTNRFEMARAHYERALALEPRNPKYVFSLGYALENLRQYTGALDCYRKVLQLHPGDVEAKEAAARVAGKVPRAVG